MKLSSLSALALVTCVTGCGMLMPQGGGASQAQPRAAAYEVPKESKDAIRKQETQAYAQADAAEDEQLERLEKDALKALAVSAGKEKWAETQAMPEPASANVKNLRAAGVKMKIAPVTNGEGKAVNDDFLQLKDEATDQLGVLSRKIAEGKASAAEKKAVQEYAKHSFKLMDLRMQVMKVSMATMMSNSHVQTSSLQTMLRVASMVRTRKMMSMELTAEDYALVRRGLERQKRAEAIAATTMGLLAAYQAVVNGKGDPKALDVITDATLKAFPLKTEVSDAEAKAYVGALGENVAKVKARYEAMLRKVHGDAKYEQKFKAGIDAMFRQAEQAEGQKSIGQMAQDNMDRFKADREKCARGEPIDPGSPAAGPGCKAARQAALRGEGGAAAGGVAIPGQVNQAAGVAGAAAKGDVVGALDGAAKMFPADGTVRNSLEGIAALGRGDAKGALNAAIGFVPVPGLKDGLALASKLLFSKG